MDLSLTSSSQQEMGNETMRLEKVYYRTQNKSGTITVEFGLIASLATVLLIAAVDYNSDLLLQTALYAGDLLQASFFSSWN